MSCQIFLEKAQICSPEKIVFFTKNCEKLPFVYCNIWGNVSFEFQAGALPTGLEHVYVLGSWSGTCVRYPSGGGYKYLFF